MTSPSKLSEAGKQQLATQIDFFQSLTSRMFENAERILALNIATTRATLAQTSGAVRQLAAARDPRDLMALGAQSQQQVEAAMAYSRKLFEIANKPAVAKAAPEAAAPATGSATEPAPAPAAEATAADNHIDTAPPVVASVHVPEVEAAAESEPAPAPSTIEASAHPLGEADPEPAPALTATAKPIAKAASKVASAPVDTPHPAAMPMPEAGPIAIPAITPVDATVPPPAKKSGGVSKGGKKR